MNHYGKFNVDLGIKKFTISLTNKRTGAIITVSGPTEGIFSSSTRRLDLSSAEDMANKLAHYLKIILE